MNPSTTTTASIPRPERPFVRRIAPDMLALVLGLGAAWALQWKTTDLVWSLWLGSLVLGYLTLLSALAAGTYVGWHAIRHPDFRNRGLAMCLGVGSGLFFFGFFALHFGGFHAGHSAFLQMFFPIEGLPADGFGAAFLNPPLLWMLVFEHLIKPYGLFLLPAVIAERQHVFASLRDAAAVVRRIREQGAPPAPKQATSDDKSGKQVFGVMGRPYINVVRMHVLIFFFAFCHFMKIDFFLVYAVVYCVYFFPWRELRRSG